MPSPIKHGNKWRIRPLDHEGKRVSLVFESYAEAKHELSKHEAQRGEIARGEKDPPPLPKTFDVLCDYWIEHRAAAKRSGKDDESIIRKHLRPAFGKLGLRDVTVAAVDQFRKGRGDISGKTLANILTLLITLLNTASDLGWLTKVPKIKKPKVKVFEKDFRYLRNKEEIGKFLTAALAEGEQVHLLYALAIYTGLRAGETAALRWSNIDFVNRRITVENSFDGLTKGGEVRYVPLLDPLVPLLDGALKRSTGELIFTNQRGGMFGESSRIFQEVLHRVLDRAGFVEMKRNGKNRRYIVFHGLRHTFASHWVMGGGDLYKLQRIMGHASIEMTMRYAHLAPEAYANDYARLGTAIARALPAAGQAS
jgi:integrase